MAAALVAERVVVVGEPVTVEAPSQSAQFGVVFEDDGETGYLYALDFKREGNPIADALHIYNVESVTDRGLPSTVKVIWSADGLKAALFINDYPHAVFDFEARRGYCRTGFPPPDTRWTDHSHQWDDSALRDFR